MDYEFPHPLPVMCQACGAYLDTIVFLSDAEYALAVHQPMCQVEEQRRQRRDAKVDAEFVRIATMLVREGFPCQ